jgi:Sigma-70 region 2
MKMTPRPAKLVAVKSDRPIGLERAHNFITKPPYQPGDKPRFDRGRFRTGTSSNLEAIDWIVTDNLVTIPGARGSILSATWERGNRLDPSARITGKIGQNKSYERLVEASERYVETTGPYDEKYLARFHQKWRGAAQSYADLRHHGKARCRPDVTYVGAAHRQNEKALNGLIDGVATTRRRQIRHRRDANLWRMERDRRRPKRLLYFLKVPRTWFELQCLIKVLAFNWVPKPTGTITHLWEYTGRNVNCVSDKAMARSRENNKRGTPKRRRITFLARAEQLDLARRAKDGDIAARNRLFVAQWPQVAAIARKYAGPQADTEDLIGQAYGGVNNLGNPVGLIYALDKYDPEKGILFSAFAGQAIEWAVKDYLRSERQHMLPSLDAPIDPVGEDGTTWAERTPASVGAFYSGGYSRTSRSIHNRIIRVSTVHISPYANGMAPETFDFVAELNAEAIRFDTGVRYIGLANRIEARGHRLHAAAECMTSLGGWFLQGARGHGYFEGEKAALWTVNSYWRKQIRKRAKRK